MEETGRSPSLRCLSRGRPFLNHLSGKRLRFGGGELARAKRSIWDEGRKKARYFAGVQDLGENLVVGYVRGEGAGDLAWERKASLGKRGGRLWRGKKAASPSTKGRRPEFLCLG